MKPPFRTAIAARVGFSLVEMLTCVAILAVLMVLLFPWISGVMERSRAVHCLQQLRQIGSLMQSYASDNDGLLRFFRDGAPTQRMWYTELQNFADFSDEQAQESFGCPTLSSEDVNAW